MGHQIAARGQIDEMPHARGPEHGGQEITRREEFVGAREVEEHDGDVVVAECLLEPDGVLD